MTKQQNRGRFGAPVVFLGCLSATFVGTACGKKDEPAVTAASSSARVSASAPAVSATVSAVPTYTGPVGTVEGRIVLKGDPPPNVPVPGEPSAKCGKVKELYGKLFRVSPDNGLADAIVGVTEYEGVLPLPTQPVVVQIHDCAFLQRTYTLSKVQSLEIYNRDPESFLPHLNGARSPSLNVAVPGQRSQIHTRGIGRYILTDDLKHEWMHADVFVFAYATHAVTKPDGTYRIEGIPIGKSKLSVVHPSFGRTVEQRIELSAGQTLKVDLDMPFDAKKDVTLPPPASASASNKPSPPAPSAKKGEKPKGIEIH